MAQRLACAESTGGGPTNDDPRVWNRTVTATQHPDAVLTPHRPARGVRSYRRASGAKPRARSAGGKRWEGLIEADDAAELGLLLMEVAAEAKRWSRTVRI
jgi:hypothetical protein